MFIKFAKEHFEVGDSIPAEVIFVNTTANPVNLKEDPQTSIDLVMHAVNAKTGEDLNYSMGKIETTPFGHDKFAMTVPKKEKFEIGAKSFISFTTDLNERLYLTPGTYECYLVNYLVEKSNKVTLFVSLTPTSVFYLLKTAVDERSSYGKREWAYDWLRKIDPHFQLQLTVDDDTPLRKKEKIAFNEKAYATFTKWWTKNHNTAEMAELLRQMNP
jgi:hypothetical protein